MIFYLFLLCGFFSALQADSGISNRYYFSKPNAAAYPILILCEGSSEKGDIGSVLFIRQYFASRIEPLNIGFLTIEKRGVDGEQIDEEVFWSHYTRSQRLADHLQVIRYFEENPPEGWNGKFILIGVSEGGALVTDLAMICPNILAAINWVGAGDWPWADEFWQFCDADRQEYDALVQHILRNPTPREWLGGMTYLYHADAFQQPPIDYSKIRVPFLVVMGTEDICIASCDQFVQKAQKAGVPITYFRIDGMDHSIRNRPDVIDQSFDWLKPFLREDGGPSSSY